MLIHRREEPYIKPDYVYHEVGAEVRAPLGPPTQCCHAVMSSLACHRTIKRTSAPLEVFQRLGVSKEGSTWLPGEPVPGWHSTLSGTCDGDLAT